MFLETEYSRRRTTIMPSSITYLTKHLNALFPEVFEEIQLALGELKFPENDWKKVHVFPFVLQIVARASNRIFVGAPFCRNQEWIDFNLGGPAEVMLCSTILNLFPTWTLPALGPIIGPINRRMRKARKMAGPLIEARLRLDPSEWPDDFITWLLVNAPESDRTVDEIVRRVLIVNFAAIHTSSLNLGHALYWLLARPKYIAPLREEIEETVGRLGWTKDAIGQMPKLESFMKECMRMTPLGARMSLYFFFLQLTLTRGTASHRGPDQKSPEAIHLFQRCDAPRRYFCRCPSLRNSP
ncbi:hypothetical protein M408DRAFT_28548 [Serendipita vermifera MAFF 305830]|uniref:Cytochrome P450 n=1 Tax=Serendipita vermifera MAFF 305830 TaxID=933852 RepID=A0A0C3ADD4_SERVB|nr:hypothetical protein M408DRAFT_28548 [Serendipita vermifera MAFF 305830]